MDKQQLKTVYTFQRKKVFNYFLQGLVVIAPIGITVWAIFSLFSFVDNILPNILHAIFPNWIKEDAFGRVQKIPGLGFLVVVIFVVLVGWLSSILMVGKLVDFFDKILERTPGIKIIYSSVKDFFEAFAGNKKKFTKPVLVNVDASDVWRIGFITNEDSSDFGIKEHLIVYVPHSYAISGITYFVPLSRIRKIDDVSAADAMKFTVTGGVVNVEDAD